MLCFEAFRPEEMILLKPERPLALFKRKASRSIKEVLKNGRNKSRDPTNQRSSSWNSSNQSDLLLAPLVADSSSKEKKSKFHMWDGLRKTSTKDQKDTSMKDPYLKLSPEDDLVQIAKES